ncbi:long chain acyl-CoA synthetase 2-like isoform X4 [Camellia sinensis]|uniref:long chain acyl-CoA synthetase 2-like isoform X4 n=1 Tax=Camellia sinensis TaxID=4442 RepID=UPI001036BDF8|nr:long chain acyl-CoA synthetase 2-like isoform X4 [Camellia sinensis]
MSIYTVKVEESTPATDQKPSAGPVYRCIYAKNALMDLPPGLDSLWDFFSSSVQRNPKNRMLGRRQIIDSKGDRCGIYGSNCPEWIISMEACNSHCITYVPLYDTLGANAVEFIINHAEVSIAFVQENKIRAILTCLARCTSHLKTIVSFGEISSGQKKEAEDLGVSCFSWKEFALLGNLDHELPKKQRSDICTIMYTSGTTGEPKGVILTNGAIMAEVLSTNQLLLETVEAGTEEDTYFSFLPLAHIYDQIIETYCIYSGSSIGFWQGDVRYLTEDIVELKPTMFCGVPRVYDRIYTGIMEKISAGGALRKTLFQYAYNYKLRNLEKGLQQDKAAPLLDKLVFDKIKQGLGGRVRILLSGAAPLPRHVEEFLRVTCCCVLSQGYGLTESCGGCFASIADEFSMMGTVGVPMTTIETRLESVPELGYNALASVPRGEICLRGKTLFSGYHKRQDLTEDVFMDGWFHTGDIGEWQPNGAMKIIDRKKNIFKLSQGEYVAVESIESTFLQCPHVTSIWVYGNSFESFLVAVVVPDRKALEEWAVNNNETGDFKLLCASSKARKYILDELNSTGQKNKLRGFEMLRAVHLEPYPFDIERDLITPTFKLKRPQLLKYYKDRIDQLYDEAKGKKE